MGSSDASAIPRTWTCGQTQSFPVSVTNSGNQTWPASGPSPVRLGLHFTGGPLQPWSSWLTDQPFALPGDLAPRHTPTTTVTAAPPPSQSARVLEAPLPKGGPL